MDHITPEERKALVGICEQCGEPVFFKRGEDKEQCSCGGKLAVQSIQTQRTFNYDVAKRRKRSRKQSAGA